MTAATAAPARPRHGERAGRAAVVVITVAALVRLALGAVLPPPPDETYYWEWSRRLALGYFDHPPAIALFVRAGVALFGVTPLGIRIVSVAAGWGASMCVLLLARRLGGGSAALRAAVIITCMPLAAAGLVLATPDAPLLLAVAATLLALDHALAAPPGGARALGWWLAAGAALGGALLSKYNAVLVPVGVLLALLMHAPLRRHLATPAPYLAALLAVLLFTPVVAWNWHHGWASFRFQLAHGLGRGDPSVLSREGSLLAGQLGLVSPILFGLLVLAVWRALRQVGESRAGDAVASREFVLAMVAATTFLFFVVSAVRRPVEPNWQAAAYVPAIVLLAVRSTSLASRRWLGAACSLGGAMIVVVYLQAVFPFLPLPAADDPTARGAGWDRVAERTAAVAAGLSVPPGGRTWIGGDRYQEASEIAFHLSSHPITVSLNLGGRPNQYDFWPVFPMRARAGDDLVLSLVPDRPGRPNQVLMALRPHFSRVWCADTVGLRRNGELIARRTIWVLEGWRGTWVTAGKRG